MRFWISSFLSWVSSKSRTNSKGSILYFPASGFSFPFFLRISFNKNAFLSILRKIVMERLRSILESDSPLNL